MKTIQLKFLLVTLLFINFSMEAQTTAIPDPGFEQILINDGIDSDGTINGQVLTADIAGIIALDLSSGGNIQDLTGIEDFSALKVLDISHAGFSNGPYPHILDLSQVTALEELYMNSGDDALTVQVNYLDLSNNPNLKKIEITYNWSIERINLQGGDLSITNLNIDLSGSYACVQVTNANDAKNGQGVYATWNLCCGGSFSENCVLGTDGFSKSNIQLYPNPAAEGFSLNSQQGIEAINIYTLQGKLVKRYSQVQENYSVTDMANGIYLVAIKTFNNRKQFLKLIKN